MNPAERALWTQVLRLVKGIVSAFDLYLKNYSDGEDRRPRELDPAEGKDTPPPSGR